MITTPEIKNNQNPSTMKGAVIKMVMEMDIFQVANLTICLYSEDWLESDLPLEAQRVHAESRPRRVAGPGVVPVI